MAVYQNRLNEAKEQGWDCWIKTDLDMRAVVDHGCSFKIEKALKVREFFTKFLRHSKGQFNGQPFTLLDWQWNDLVAPLYGWVRPDGTRRYRKAYVEIPKKNGKSTLCAGIELYGLVGDGEPGAEVYTAAADREQASIVYSEAANMVEASPSLSSRLMVIRSLKRIAYPKMKAFMRALSADVKTKEGINASLLVFDELHAQPNRDLWDALEHAGAARRQPLLLSITTAGTDKESICYEEHQKAEAVIKCESTDWTYLGVIYAANADKDDWRLPETHKKANPSYGITIEPDKFNEACAAAIEQPRKENNFKRYRLNIWTEQETRWLQVERWDELKREINWDDFKGLPCWAGLDLSSTNDLTCFGQLFRTEEGFFYRPHFFCPEENARRRQHEDKVPYLDWIRDGWITATPGDWVDYDRVRVMISGAKNAFFDNPGKLAEWQGRHGSTEGLIDQFPIQAVAIDRWAATQIVQQLQGDGLNVMLFGQGFASMSGPSKEWEKMILAGRLFHDGNPVLRWMIGNTAVVEDAAENIKPVKLSPKKRIDGVIAGIMAKGVEMANPDDGGSVYDDRPYFITS